MFYKKTESKHLSDDNLNGKPSKKALKIFIIIASVVLALILIPTSAFLILSKIGKNQFHSGDTNISVPTSDILDVDEDVVTYEGKSYVLNPDIVSILFMGIDKSNINEDNGYGKNGQADSIFLAAINTSDKSVKIIPISRETMVDINLYSEDGTYTGVKKEQLCLAYAYGSTPESCSQNVITSVSRILYGINIGSYITVDLKGVGAITDVIGGVSVNALETLENSKYSITEGQNVNLKGDSAIYYVQNRANDVEANNRRMQRQKQFLSAFASTAGNQIMSNFTKLTTYYNTMKPYIVTDLTLSKITYLASSCLTMDIGNSIQYLSIDGATAIGEKWVEFVPDKNSVFSVVLNAFYVEK